MAKGGIYPLNEMTRSWRGWANDHSSWYESERLAKLPDRNYSSYSHAEKFRLHVNGRILDHVDGDMGASCNVRRINASPTLLSAF